MKLGFMPIAVVGSMVAHAAFFELLGFFGDPASASADKILEMQVEEKPRQQSPAPPKEPPPPPPVQPQEVDLRNVQPEEIRDVFGVSEDSVSEGGDFAVPVGTTLMKEPEPEFVPLPLVTSLPSFRSKVDPEYPEEARRAGLEAVVILEVGIDADGKVYDARVVQSAGHGFDETALDAIKASTFHPARRGDEAVAVRIRIPVRFSLR